MSMEIFVSRSGRARGSLPWRAAAMAWADAATPVAVTAIRAKAPVGKGRRGGQLRDSLRDSKGFRGAGLQVLIGSNTPQARFLRDGTKAHDITPHKRTRGGWTGPHTGKPGAGQHTLHWVDGSGTDHFSMLVHHPGTKPNPFAKDALREVAPVLRKLFLDVMRESLGGEL